MNKDVDRPSSHLFTVRLWPEELDDDCIEWRGQVQHVLSGERRYFRDWVTLVAILQAKLGEMEGANGEL